MVADRDVAGVAQAPVAQLHRPAATTRAALPARTTGATRTARAVVGPTTITALAAGATGRTGATTGIQQQRAKAAQTEADLHIGADATRRTRLPRLPGRAVGTGLHLSGGAARLHR
ncbi:hypothetical protein D3C84_171100 [compost metagenome]